MRNSALAELLTELQDTDTPGVENTTTPATSSPWSVRSAASEFSLPSGSPNKRRSSAGTRDSFANMVEESVTVADMFPDILTNPLFIGFGENSPGKNNGAWGRRSSVCLTPQPLLSDEDCDGSDTNAREYTPPNEQYGARTKRAEDQSDEEWVDGWASGRDTEQEVDLRTDDDSDQDDSDDHVSALVSDTLDTMIADPVVTSVRGRQTRMLS